MKRKLTVLSREAPQDIVEQAHHFIDKLDHYQQHADDYADQSPRQPAADEVAGYCDFYRSQAVAAGSRGYDAASRQY